MTKKTQLCYTDETLGEQMLVTFIGPDQYRELHMISTTRAEHLKNEISLLEDGDGVRYIAYRALGRPYRSVYIGWSCSIPTPGETLEIKGFEAKEIDKEILDGIKTNERSIYLNISRNQKKGFLEYGNVWICEVMLQGEEATAVIQLL